MGIRAVFINAKEQREVAAGTTVFAEGDTGAEMYGLIAGAVELRKGEQSLGVLEPGDTFGELAIVSEAPRSLTAIATEQSVLAVIDDKAFLFLVHETPTFALQVMRSMADRIRNRRPLADEICHLRAVLGCKRSRHFAEHAHPTANLLGNGAPLRRIGNIEHIAVIVIDQHIALRQGGPRH